MEEESCHRCTEPAVIFQRYSGRYLCARHLAADILVRVKRTIRLQGGLGKKPVLAYLWEGGGCIPLLYMLGLITGSRPAMRFCILCQGDDTCSDPVIRSVLPSGVEVKIMHVRIEELSDAVAHTGADRLIRGHFLEEVAGEILHNLLSGCISDPSHSDPFLPLVLLEPLKEIPCAELNLFAEYYHIPGPEPLLTPDDTRELLDALSENHPSVPFSLLRYADRIHDLGWQHDDHSILL